MRFILNPTEFRMRSFVVCCIVLCRCAAAQPSSPFRTQEVVTAYLKEHGLEIKLSEGRLIGPAADWFRAEAAKAQFFFIGEEHDIRKIPIEAGQWLGGRLDSFARFDDREALAQFQSATWPRLPNNSVPPNSQEDLTFYELIGKVSEPHTASKPPVIWGLAYEYRATPLLKRLVGLIPPGKRGQAERLVAKVQAAEAAGNYDTVPFRTRDQ
jgi:hypothetical protein